MNSKLVAAIEELENHLPFYERLQPEVSGGSVGWHIEHSLLTINAVLDGLTRSRPEDYRSRFDVRRFFVLFVGKIPRGKVKAPKIVRPAPGIDAAALQQHLLRTKARLPKVEELSPGHYFTHPFLGDFRLKPALRFLYIHTRHHLSIIRDIRRQAVTSKEELHR